ncbi:MAG TPA: c-type cytochrome [Alphaproteobacteria bacterium]|jgi:mono/diheme cytochrome c family protein|nr:c-type cytochrome [Alphaproteobacteria bacterium]
MAATAKRLHRIAFLSFAAALALGAAPALAQQEKVLNDGKIEYEENCASCHGPSGMGEGRLANMLTMKPPDLTRIAKRNGGAFPFWKVYAIIGGETPVRAHELSPMPIWASRFRAEEQTHWYAPAHVRILLLTHYLESIQEK